MYIHIQYIFLKDFYLFLFCFLFLNSLFVPKNRDDNISDNSEPEELEKSSGFSLEDEFEMLKSDDKFFPDI